ncbi:Putative FAD dependent oxidoreductase, FAD/NAD(P)-binding domain superfamily, MTOX family [Septoria linicola]|uniref:FAD dependent oxidoreductase, FAD/NAD(P)-binding domain superfamily, MTOX family n=1 Tax=Septoria linicola TaxID=215465 RepID=A0A9Q9AWJ4_9PEZI|nr:putative FAD dependent oxidoreductase, FAD/NAD(P)-binding domain superfamily, MTOX family [Septoria linicola]USW53136.1 Putative FAD dependent oxidoreductase, FAD/NAD(P)-binding domain superfamily, MTOX family [Septoria linicola]
MATSTQLQKDSKFVIVGAGVFGLSTTLHLIRRGYTNIHLFDRQPFDKNQYDETKGADGASCDLNKIVRASYGDAKLYQDLAFNAMPEWEKWNAQLAATPQAELPSSLDPSIPLWHKCGFLRLSSDGLEPKEEETQQNFPPDIKHTQYRVSDSERRADAAREGIPSSKIDPFRRVEKSLPTDGILDTTAGFVLASRACTWALHLALLSGYVTTHFGADNALQSLMKTGNRISGIVTSGFERHSADFVLVATGGWTPSLIPEVDRLLETTSGSVLSVQLPKDRQDLWDKYSEERFPVWSWNMGSYVPHQKDSIGGLYGLPRTPEGIVKVAFRGAKWTSYTRRSSVGEELSYPKTDVEKVPEEAMRVMRGFVEENLPDLLELDLSNLRLCWYTDSIDNSFLVDHVPDIEGLVVASGGSGHGFKFLPVLGEHIVNVIEKKDTEYTRLFKWRKVPTGKRNGLEDGPEGWRTLDKQRMVGNDEWRARRTEGGSKL